MALQFVTIAQVTVTTGGTEVRIAANTDDKIVKLFLSVPASNTGNVWVGDANVAVGRGVEIVKGSTLQIDCEGQYIDAYNIWADAVTNGDKINISYLKKVSS